METPPPPTGATLPVLETPAPPEIPGLVKKPAPPPSESQGLGLIVGAGVVGGVAVASAIGRMVIVSRACGVTDDAASATTTTIFSCVQSARNLFGLTLLQWLANVGTYALAPTAGMTRARYDASNYMFTGKPERNGALLSGLGGGLLAAGVVTKVALWVTIRSRFTCEATTEGTDSCVRRRFSGYFGSQQLASMAIAAGAGLLAYGVYYRKDRAAKERLYFSPDAVTVSPSVSRSFTGLSLSGRF